ncbi:hypothetical protein [Kocuria salsicia]|uniref:Uncharacterized protein n=1 Tax=Kocuria salsicia TaxID=664639 RepID=A0ABV3KE26_9MICC
MFDAQSSDVERVYVFHGTDSTQVLGPEHLMGRVRGLLTAAGTAAAPGPPLHPDITLRPFTAEAGQDPGGSGGSWARQHSTVSDLSVEIGAQRFWDRVEAGSWATWREQWPDSPDGALFPPSPPDWLLRAPRWELDPLAPALGPAASGGWVRSPAQGWGDPAAGAGTGTGGLPAPRGHHGVGLFQLTDLESFWVFSSEAETRRIVTRCESLARDHSAFTWLTGYFDARDVAGSLRLPAECLPVLETDLAAAGYTVDTWW